MSTKSILSRTILKHPCCSLDAHKSIIFHDNGELCHDLKTSYYTKINMNKEEAYMCRVSSNQSCNTHSKDGIEVPLDFI